MIRWRAIGPRFTAGFLGLVVLIAAPAAAVPRDRADRSSLDRFARERAVARLLLVRVHYSWGPELAVEIPEAARVRGLPPRLIDDESLAARVELLDRRGRTLWSIGFRPPERPPVGEQQGVAADLFLRLPHLPKAVKVRVTEPDRGLTAERSLRPGTRR